MLFLSTKINFEQNDDWAFYRAVRSYIAGDFSQNPIQIFGKSAPLFYTQGLMALGFASVFSFSSIPSLTAFISALNGFILACILFKFYKRTVVESTILSGLLLFNPIYIYSSLGFMTENYFLFFLLLSIYFYLSFEENPSKKPFVLFNVFMVLGFFVRQFSIFSCGAFAFVLLLKKRYTYFFVQMGITAALIGFYYVYFLSNDSYSYKGVDLNKARDSVYFITLIFGLLVTFSAYLFPLILGFARKDLVTNKRFLLLTAVCYIVFFGFFYTKANPDLLNKGEFPFIGNTVERTGFFNSDMHGTKYHFIGIHKLYYYWQAIAVLLAPLVLVAVFASFKKLFGFFGAFLGVYTLTLLFLTKIFDRYLTVFLLIFILFVVGKNTKFTKIQQGIMAVYVAFIMLLAYQFSWDFVLVRQFAWNRGFSLMEQEQLEPSDLIVTRTWNKTYSVGLDTAYPIYLVSYDSPEILSKKECCRSLVEEKVINYPFNFYVNPKLFLYQR